MNRYANGIGILISLLVCGTAGAQSDQTRDGFLQQHCHSCHSGESAEAGLDFSTTPFRLSDETLLERWVRIYDRVAAGEMPPADSTQPAESERLRFLSALVPELSASHRARRSAVLRRLNRREYQNTMNDLFGTQLQLESMLPEDGLAAGYDNNAAALGLSMVHLQKYIEAASAVLDAATADRSEPPEVQTVTAGYAETREAEQFVGKVWKKLSDDAVVRFSGGGYPSGMMRGTEVRPPGRYRVTVSGYAYQSSDSIEFSVEGTSFLRGSGKPIYGFWSFPPGEPGRHSSIEFETRIDERYMIAIEPWGISDPQRYQRKSIDDYEGPGLAIVSVTLEGPLHDEWPLRGHRLIFDGLDRKEIMPRNPEDRKRRWYRPKFEVLSEDPLSDASVVLRRVASAAFRRPVSDNDTAEFRALFERELQAGDSFEESLRTAVSAIFCSPRFLYLQEGSGELDAFALASRLSYFLNRSSPDSELLAASADGSLLRDEVLRQHTDRLMQSPHFQRFIDDFTDSWLNLREIDFTQPDAALFPEFDSYLRYSMLSETRAFLRELVEQDLSILNLVDSDFAMLNSRLATHYELPAVDGTELRRVRLPADSVRGGLLGQASVLKVTANGTNSSPVVRGAWVTGRLLGEPPPPPPPGIPGVEPDVRGAVTLRELLERHRSLPECRSCHRMIDPPGFALECFNPIGGYRDRYRSLGTGDRVQREVNGRQVRYRLGPDVDTSGETPDGRSFGDLNDYRRLLAADPERLARALTENLLMFAVGREVGFSDREELSRITAAAASSGYGVRSLIHELIQSELFRAR